MENLLLRFLTLVLGLLVIASLFFRTSPRVFIVAVIVCLFFMTSWAKVG